MGAEAGYLGKVVIGSAALSANTVAEMGAWNISGMENDMLDETEFTDTFKNYVLGMGDGGTVTFSGNYDSTNTAGQVALKTLYETQASTQAIRLYFGDGYNDYFFCDEDTTCIVQSVDDLGTDQSGLGKIGFTLKVSGGFMRKAVGSWDSSVAYKVDFSDAGFTITKDGGMTSFVALGFVAAQTLIVRGTTLNNSTFTIDAGGVAADVLTVTAATVLEANEETARLISY